MGAHIEAVCALTNHGWRKPIARRLADSAARTCLANAGKAAADVDMLINAGVYREDGMGEPALAALVQEDIGANLGRSPTGEGHGTFSFDLINGGCGVINAIQIEAGLLRSGVIRLGGIVASDVHPNLKNARAALFRPTGGALLLNWDDRIAGFTDFYTETFPEYEDLFASGLVWQKQHGPHHIPQRGTGEHLVVVDERLGYHARLVDCAEEATRNFLNHLGMGIGDIDLFVPAPSYADFVDPLVRRLDVPADRVAYVAEDLEGAYTTGPIAALQAAIRSGRLGEARNTVMLAAGAGITAALALYRQAPAEEASASNG
jgi:3-oxoacyl-[acyl-carrier-protein] synthase-3